MIAAAARYPVAWSSACAGSAPGLASPPRLFHRDPARRLHETVEPAARPPRPNVAPGAQVQEDEPGVARRERGGCQAELVERSRPVGRHEHVGIVEEMLELGVTDRRPEVDERAALPDQPVERQCLHLGERGCVDAQHVGAVRGERARAHGSCDHAREVEHAHPVERARRPSRGRARAPHHRSGWAQRAGARRAPLPGGARATRRWCAPPRHSHRPPRRCPRARPRPSARSRRRPRRRRRAFRAHRADDPGATGSSHGCGSSRRPWARTPTRARRPRARDRRRPAGSARCGSRSRRGACRARASARCSRSRAGAELRGREQRRRDRRGSQRSDREHRRQHLRWPA